ncbi:MAG: Pr6Pr family membrane protein [Telluria sp.]
MLLQLWLSINLAFAKGDTVMEGLVVYFGFYTVLTNLFVALTATLPLVAGASKLGRFFAKPTVLGCATTSIVLVGIAYHFLLRHVWNPQGLQLLADIILHYAVPIATLAYWLAFSPRYKLSVLAPVAWIIYPLGYFVYVFARGELLGSYPYYFIDAASIGYRQAILNSLGLFLAFIVLGAVVIAAAALRNRFRAPLNPARG